MFEGIDWVVLGGSQGMEDPGVHGELNVPGDHCIRIAWNGMPSLHQG